MKLYALPSAASESLFTSVHRALHGAGHIGGRDHFTLELNLKRQCERVRYEMDLDACSVNGMYSF